jgi:DNA-binding FadR family transcriptional regulator
MSREKSVAVTDAAIDKIKQMIVSGELAPGDRLREAVRALSLINVLDVRQGDGTYVTSLEPHLLLDTMSFVLDLHRDDTVLQFFEVRRILEPAATAMATKLMKDEEIDELRVILESLPAEPTVEELVANDLRFHQRIAQGSGNSVLCSFIESLSGPTTRARVWRGLTQEGAMDKTREQHTAIYEAIAARQADVARSWATVHVAGVESWLRKALQPD